MVEPILQRGNIGLQHMLVSCKISRKLKQMAKSYYFTLTGLFKGLFFTFFVILDFLYIFDTISRKQPKLNRWELMIGNIVKKMFWDFFKKYICLSHLCCQHQPFISWCGVCLLYFTLSKTDTVCTTYWTRSMCK